MWFILKKKKNSDCISLHCFINVKDPPNISIILTYSPTFVHKKVACNDNTCSIKLTLWGSCIDYVNESGVYFIQEAKVREWPNWILSMTTTPSKSIKPPKENTTKPKSSLKELISYSVQFPTTSNKNCIIHKMLPTVWEIISKYVYRWTLQKNDISIWNKNQAYFET